MATLDGRQDGCRIHANRMSSMNRFREPDGSITIPHRSRVQRPPSSGDAIVPGGEPAYYFSRPSSSAGLSAGRK